MSTGLETMASVAAGQMVNAMVVGIVVTMVAWVLLRIARRTNSGARFAIWFSVLMAVPVLPIAATLFNNNSTAVTSSPRITLPGSLAFGIFVTWAVLAGFGLLRIAYGIWRIHKIRRGCSVIEISRMDANVRQMIASYRPQRSFTLLESDKVRVPTAIGFFKPAVILPSWCLNELSSEELSATLIHEFAHLRRWDDWTNLLQKVLRALFFFHPAVWWLDNRLALEREMACDDLVLVATDNPRAYAQCLVSLAEKSVVRRSLALAQAAVHGLRHMSLRISQIMDVKHPRATRIWTPTLSLMAALFTASFVGMVHAPTLVAFQPSASGSSTSLAGSAYVPPVVSRESQPAVRMIPASLKTGTAKTSKNNRKLAQHSAGTKRPPRVGDRMLVATASNRDRTPVVVPASVKQENNETVGSMLLVMHDEVIDSSGRRVAWTMAVWRVTVYRPPAAPANEGTVAKSI
jgi:beta-lactamase regulating signal transducer with metallopeptidase domain